MSWEAHHVREEDDMRAMDAATEMDISCPDSHGSDITIQHDKGVLSNMPDTSLLDTKAHERRWQRCNVKESRTPQTAHDPKSKHVARY